MPALGQTPADTPLVDVVWPTGALAMSILPEEEMPGFVLADGRRIVVGGANAELYSLIGHDFETAPGVNPGDGKFRVPPFVESAANGSQSRMPIGQDEDPGAPAALQQLGGVAGQLGHVHAGGTLALASHAHGAGSLVGPSHGHGDAFSFSHLHALFNDNQPIALVGGNTELYNGTVEYLVEGQGNLQWYLVDAVNPGVAGAIGTPVHSLAISGSTATPTPASLPVTGNTDAADPASLAMLFYVKL